MTPMASFSDYKALNKSGLRTAYSGSSLRRYAPQEINVLKVLLNGLVFGFGFFVGQKEILPGVFAMFGGNGNQVLTGSSDTDVNFDDRTYWEGENGDIARYRNGDYNLNGDANFNDRLEWEINNGKFTSVPRDQ